MTWESLLHYGKYVRLQQPDYADILDTLEGLITVDNRDDKRVYLACLLRRGLEAKLIDYKEYTLIRVYLANLELA